MKDGFFLLVFCSFGLFAHQLICQASA